MSTAQISNGAGRHGSRSFTVERVASLVGGGALALWGVKRLVDHRSPANVGMTAAAGLLIANGIRNPQPRLHRVSVNSTFTINKSPEEVFRFWRSFDNLPRFMQHLESVQCSGDRSHWTARGPMGAKLSWDAEIVDEKQNEWIVWKSLPESPLEMTGSVQFRRAAGNRGAVVTVAIQYLPMAGGVGRILAALLGELPERQLKEELRRFKQLMEAGEIPTTEGQPSGRRSTVVSMMHKAMGKAERGRSFAGTRTA
ncbi:MAG: SRPBCC family protein [Terriglobales bacterium]